ncbi:hypothetical protein SFRURICE_000302 [Spodoptera frugiperda]|nr:hypothetical protein SFRURICE_000302 [Spodoptera frugiperda]
MFITVETFVCNNNVLTNCNFSLSFSMDIKSSNKSFEYWCYFNLILSFHDEVFTKTVIQSDKFFGMQQPESGIGGGKPVILRLPLSIVSVCRSA